MKDVVAGPTPDLLKSFAEIFQILLIDEFDFACRCQSMNKSGNAIDDQAKIEFARTQGFLGALPVFNVSGYTIPANHATTGTPQGLSCRTKPAIDVIEPAHTLVYFTRLTGFDGMQPCLFRSLDILGMEYVSPSKTHQVLLAFGGEVQNALI